MTVSREMDAVLRLLQQHGGSIEDDKGYATRHLREELVRTLGEKRTPKMTGLANNLGRWEKLGYIKKITLGKRTKRIELGPKVPDHYRQALEKTAIERAVAERAAEAAADAIREVEPTTTRRFEAQRHAGGNGSDSINYRALADSLLAAVAHHLAESGDGDWRQQMEDRQSLVRKLTSAKQQLEQAQDTVRAVQMQRDGIKRQLDEAQANIERMAKLGPVDQLSERERRELDKFIREAPKSPKDDGK